MVEEEQKLIYQQAHPEVVREHQTHEDIVTYYHLRKECCLAKLEKCKAKLSLNSSEKSLTSSSDSDPLLEATESSTLRHRHLTSIVVPFGDELQRGIKVIKLY